MIILALVANVTVLISLAPLPRDANVVSTYSALLHPGFALRGHSQAARLLELIDGSPGEVDLCGSCRQAHTRRAGQAMMFYFSPL